MLAPVKRMDYPTLYVVLPQVRHSLVVRAFVDLYLGLVYHRQLLLRRQSCWGFGGGLGGLSNPTGLEMLDSKASMPVLQSISQRHFNTIIPFAIDWSAPVWIKNTGTVDGTLVGLVAKC